MFDVITIGSATRDVFVRSAALEVQESGDETHALEACFPLGAKIDIDELVFETGGGATNAATTFARLGLKTAIICAVGEDENGRDVLETLKADGISTRLVQTAPNEQTGYSIIILAGSGERTILVRRGAARSTDAELIPWRKVSARWFYISSLGGNVDLLERLLDRAESIGAKVAWNPGNGELKLGLERLEPLMRRVDVFNLNREEASALTGIAVSDIDAIVENLRSLPKRVLLVTDGQRGTYSAEGDSLLHSPTVDVPRVNTTGAGDAFGSGFVAGLASRNDVRYALAVGTWNATGLVQEMGAKRGLLNAFPTDEQIEEIATRPWK